MSNENTPNITPDDYRHVVGYEWLYLVGAGGRVVRRERIILDKRCGVRVLAWCEMKPVEVHGYFYVSLTDFDGRHNRHALHRIVCEAFHGSPVGKLEVNHKDGNKANNAASNLEWVTRTENLLHAANNGLMPVGAGSHFAKLTEAQVHEIRALWAQRAGSQAAIGRQFGVSQTCINKIVNGRKWKQLAAA